MAPERLHSEPGEAQDPDSQRRAVLRWPPQCPCTVACIDREAWKRRHGAATAQEGGIRLQQHRAAATRHGVVQCQRSDNSMCFRRVCFWIFSHQVALTLPLITRLNDTAVLLPVVTANSHPWVFDDCLRDVFSSLCAFIGDVGQLFRLSHIYSL